MLELHFIRTASGDHAFNQKFANPDDNVSHNSTQLLRDAQVHARCCCKGASRAIQSPHDGDGELHLAFAIPSAELANWESLLQERGIAVEEKRNWEAGGCSPYFRDPDRHLIELATPGTWSVY